MTTQGITSASLEPLASRTAQAMECVWLLTVFSVPLVFATTELMANGYEVPRVTLYRSLVGVLAALWIIKLGLGSKSLNLSLRRTSLIRSKEWLGRHPTRWLMVAAFVMFAGDIISTLLSPSISVSFWGNEPGRDGDGLYNSLSHIVLFAIVATHLRTEDQLWRLVKVLIASGLVVGSYGFLQYYGLDPFGVHLGGNRIVSSLGNPTHVGAFLLMMTPLVLAAALKPGTFSHRSASVIVSAAVLMVLLMALVFTQARGPTIGLATALIIFLAVVSISLEWRSAVRGLILLSLVVALTWALINFGPPPGQAEHLPPTGRAELVSRALSITDEISGAASSDLNNSGETARTVEVPSSLKGRLLIWEASSHLLRNRQWFEFDDRSPSIGLHLFGYGPEFFRHVFELVRPEELTSPQRTAVYSATWDAHNYFVHRTVEQGVFGLVSLGALLLVLSVIALRLLLGDSSLQHRYQKLVMAALLAAIAGRVVEQLVGVPHMSDKMLFWTMLGVLVSLPAFPQRQDKETVTASYANDTAAPTITLKSGKTLKITMAIIIAAVVLAFTLVNNPSFALAEFRASQAEESLEEGRLDEAMRQVGSAISSAPGVGRYHVTRGRILDEARRATSTPIDQVRLAQESYLTNQRAVETNQFDIYSRLFFAESALTLAGMGQTAATGTALGEFQRLTMMLPRYWLSHFLLARAYVETGSPERSLEPFGEAIRLNPEFPTLYDFRATAYETLSEHELAVKDYDTIIELKPTHFAFSQRAIAHYSLGRSDETLSDFSSAIVELNKRIEGASNGEEVIRFSVYLSLAHNNRGSVLQEAGQAEKAIDDYTEAIQLNPRLGEAFYNRATAFAVMGNEIEARRDLNTAIDLGFDPPSSESSSTQQSQP